MSENGHSGENGNGHVAQKAVERDANGRWVKGVAPNPTGYNGKRNSIRDYLTQDDVRHAVHAIRSLLTSDDGKLRLDAAQDILDRFFGKAKQAVEMSGNVTVEVEEVRNEMRDRLERIIAASGSIPEAN